MEFDREVDVGKSQIGNIEGHLVALLCYLLGWIPGLIFFVGESENRFIRFHALQSLLLTLANVAVTAVLSIPIAAVSLLTCGIGSVFYIVPSTLTLIFRIIALIKAVQKQSYKIPVIGDLAERWSELPALPSAPPPAQD